MPTVAQVAADDPETAAKIVHPMILAWRSRPGSLSSQGESPLNMSSESRVRKRISPIQMNSGSAVSVHDEDEPQMVITMLSPTGRLVNSAMPIQATPISVRPIQTPLPRMTNSARMRKVVT